MVTIAPSSSHLFPLVPTAWALRNAGHDIVLALPEGVVPAGRNAGLPVAELPDINLMENMLIFFAEYVERVGMDGLTEDEARQCAIRGFTRIADQAADPLVSLTGCWRPDIIMHEPMDFAGPLAAAHMGVPTAMHGWGVWPFDEFEDVITERMKPVYERFKLNFPSPEPAERFDVWPASIEYPNSPSVRHVRFVPYNGSAAVPHWVLDSAGRRRVCVTLGASLGGQGGLEVSLLTSLLRGVADLDVEVIATLDEVDTTDLGDLPSNVRIERWLPLHQLLSSCDLLVHHGGAGSALTALERGVPQLILPQLADRVNRAKRLTAGGVGRHLTADEVDAAAVRESTKLLLDDETISTDVARIRDEIASLPSVADAAASFRDLL